MDQVLLKCNEYQLRLEVIAAHNRAYDREHGNGEQFTLGLEEKGE